MPEVRSAGVGGGPVVKPTEELFLHAHCTLTISTWFESNGCALPVQSPFLSSNGVAAASVARILRTRYDVGDYTSPESLPQRAAG